MTRTLVQQARDAGDLVFLLDTRGRNYTDQSGNTHKITLPTGSGITRHGLRVTAEPAYIDLDMSAINKFVVFCWIKDRMSWANSPKICEFTSNQGLATDGFEIRQNTFGNPSALMTTSGSSFSSGSWMKIRTEFFLSAEFDRTASSDVVQTWVNGIYDTTNTDSNTPDSSYFANDTLYLLGRDGGTTYLNTGVMPVFGIIDLTGSSRTKRDHTVLYTEVRDRRTI